MPRYRFFFIAMCVSLTALGPGDSVAEKTTSPQRPVLLLGVYHFNNPGADEYNTVVDDYFAPQRQEELEEVVELLLPFAPTKVFVERRPSEQAQVDEEYRAYLEGVKQLTDFPRGRSETYQIGFRLAKRMGHETVYCIDAHGLWLGSRVARAAETHELEFYDEYTKLMDARFVGRSDRLNDHSVVENLIEFNRQESIMDNHTFYNLITPRVADPRYAEGTPRQEQSVDGEDFLMIGIDRYHIGAELTGEWYKRNLRIYGNLLRALDQRGDRGLVLFGQGHIRPLQHFVEDNPTLELVGANEYLE
jgi:hypothetical protein